MSAKKKTNQSLAKKVQTKTATKSKVTAKKSTITNKQAESRTIPTKAPVQSTQPKRSISLYLFPQKKLERSQKTYKGIAIATIAMLYIVILFVGFVSFNFEVMFFPK